jgi:cytochrome c biogenesis protein CcmG, thiol:disulfide interchange protein DsbE
VAWSRRRSVLVGVVAGIAVGTLAAVAIGLTGSASTPDARLTQPGIVQEPEIGTAKDVSGTPLPDHTFDLLAGGSTSFARYRGKPLVLNVWASWCPPCQQEMPAFEQVHQALGDRVQFAGLDRADSRSDAKSFATQRGITYDLLFDPSDEFAPAVGIAVMPTTLLVSPDGVVVKTHAGVMDAAELTKLIDQTFPA